MVQKCVLRPLRKSRNYVSRKMSATKEPDTLVLDQIKAWISKTKHRLHELVNSEILIVKV